MIREVEHHKHRGGGLLHELDMTVLRRVVQAYNQGRIPEELLKGVGIHII